jgi:mannose-6-phosphate isomerase-like protein (cupin superfamily)
MSGYAVDIEARTLENDYFREVLFTARHTQLVVMTLQPGEEIGMERHPGRDQFIRVEAGEGEAVIDGERHALSDGSALVIPGGAEHNVVNTSRGEPLRLYTLYSPPEHPDGTRHRNKREAEEYERSHHHA